MDYPQSQYLRPSALRGLCKLGDVILPGTQGLATDFPKFSETGCIFFIDELLAASNPADIKSLGLLLSLLSIMPRGCIYALIKLTELDPWAPKALAPTLRTLGIALRGVPISLYYSNLSSANTKVNKVHDALAYVIRCKRDDAANFTAP